MYCHCHAQSFASDLAYNHGKWLAKIFHSQEVITKSKNPSIIIIETPVTGLAFRLVNKRHSIRSCSLFDSFPLLMTKVKTLMGDRETEGAICKLASFQLAKICCITRQLVCLFCICSSGGLCIVIPFSNGSLAVVGIFCSM